MKSINRTLAKLIVALCLATNFISASEVSEKRIGLRISSEEKRASQHEEVYAQEAQEEDEVLIQERYNRDPFSPNDYSKFQVKEIGINGYTITLSNDSVWILKPSDAAKITKWSDNYSSQTTGYAPSDVYITTNNNWFFDRSYDFRIFNMDTQESVYCNLSTSPGKHCRNWILNIDAQGGTVEITNMYGDYQIMYLNPSDIGVYSDWQKNDLVIFGRNSKWGSQTSSPYILIDLDTLTSARCDL